MHTGDFMTDYEQAISFGELHKGLMKSRRNVMWKDSVAGYSINALKNTYKLRKSLLNGRYKLDPYQTFTIREPKVREIVATRIKDRQLQRSLCDNILYPQITRSFIRDNCACQIGRGVDDALGRMEAHLHRYYRRHGPEGWVLQCDIKQYFSSTRHDVAKAAIWKRVNDRDAADKACDIIDSFGKNGVGVGLGSQVSQITELAVLDDLDHYIKERLRVKHYIRYMDDFILLHHDKAFLSQCLKEIREQLGSIGLELNKKTHIYPICQGVKFLKWRFLLTDSGKVVRKMNRKSISKERRKLRKLRKLMDEGRISGDDIRANYDSWKANAKRGNTRGVIMSMDKYYADLFGEEIKHGKSAC